MDSRAAASVPDFYKASSLEQNCYRGKNNSVSSEASGTLQLPTPSYEEAFYGTKKDPIFTSSPVTHYFHSQMHEKIVSQGQRDSLCGSPSHFLPQKCPSPSGPPKGLNHPPLDEAASPNHSLVDELPKRQIKITTLERKWL